MIRPLHPIYLCNPFTGVKPCPLAPSTHISKEVRGSVLLCSLLLYHTPTKPSHCTFGLL